MYIVVQDTYFICLFFISALLMLQPPVGHGLLIHEASGSHNGAPQSIGLLWTSDQLVAETYTWQHTTLKTNIHAHGGIRTHNYSKRAAADLRLRPRGHWDRQDTYLGSVNGDKTISKLNVYSSINSGMTGCRRRWNCRGVVESKLFCSCNLSYL